MLGWFSAFLGLEEEAHYIRAYEAQSIHELLQTEDRLRSADRRGAQRPGGCHRSQSGPPYATPELLTRPSVPRLLGRDGRNGSAAGGRGP
jgi:hypothetical protein